MLFRSCSIVGRFTPLACAAALAPAAAVLAELVPPTPSAPRASFFVAIPGDPILPESSGGIGSHIQVADVFNRVDDLLPGQGYPSDPVRTARMRMRFISAGWRATPSDPIAPVPMLMSVSDDSITTPTTYTPAQHAFMGVRYPGDPVFPAGGSITGPGTMHFSLSMLFLHPPAFGGGPTDGGGPGGSDFPFPVTHLSRQFPGDPITPIDPITPGDPIIPSDPVRVMDVRCIAGEFAGADVGGYNFAQTFRLHLALNSAFSTARFTNIAVTYGSVDLSFDVAFDSLAGANTAGLGQEMFTMSIDGGLIPAPGMAALAGLAGLVAMRRRRPL